MSRMPKKTPQNRGAKQTWSWIDVAPNDKWKGFVAGPCVWVDAHFVGQHKPCRESMTNGEMPCRYSHNTYRVELIGYLPLFDLNHRPFVITVKDYAYDLVEQLPRRREVLVSRGPKKIDPVEVRLTGSTVRMQTSLDWKMNDCDIEPWLLVFWKDHEYAEWWHKQPDNGPTQPTSGKGKGAKLSPEATQEKVIEVIRSNFVVADPPPDVARPIGDDLPDLMRHFRTPGKNGNHTKKGG